MTPAALLASLRSRNIRVWVVAGENWTWRPMLHPATALTEEDRANLALHREALLALILAEPESERKMSYDVGRRCLLILANEGERLSATRPLRFAEPHSGKVRVGGSTEGLECVEINP